MLVTYLLGRRVAAFRVGGGESGSVGWDGFFLQSMLTGDPKGKASN